MGPDRSVVRRLRIQFSKGQRVKLLEMDDPQVPPEGTEGTVEFVDDMGTIHIMWDNGSSLGAVYGVDRVKKI